MPALVVAVAWTAAGPLRAGGGADDAAGAEFFERKIRPILVERCHKCHGGDKARGGLSLSGRDSVLRGGNRGPAAVPGKPGDSLMIEAVQRRGELRMPPVGKLSPGEIDRLAHWVELGLPWPEPHAATRAGPLATTSARSNEQTDWWAFRTIRAAGPPAVKDASWPRTEIDRFILAGLEARGMRPSPPAERRTLIRRATFDLTGLPPTAEEVESFLADRSPDAFARLVNRLLASPAYGERWARHWLDVVRYTDYFYPEPNAHPRASLFELFEAWRYRDWVVGALNRDLPYDQFIMHQIAGDLLPDPDGGPICPAGIVATGLLALSVFDNGDADKIKIVSDIVDDQIDVVGKAFLALTLACARCHDHKFDPIPTRDYYGLAGIFHSTRILAEVGGVGDHTVALRVPLVAKSYLGRREQQLNQLAGLEAIATGLEKLRDSAPALAGLAAWSESMVLSARLPVAGLLTRLAGSHGAILIESALGRVVARRETVRGELLPEPPRALAAQDGGTPGGMFTGIQDVPVHVRGSHTRLGPIVPRHLPGIFGERPAPITAGSGRLDLARWIARADNPLTSRVMVNRIWQHHFGAGLVRTPSNFGRLSAPPSHPALLDWLADRFIQDGWSIKALHRRILMSAVYQQSSHVGPQVLEQDPENHWLARMNPRRLEAEAIRDAILLVAGRLNRTPRGPAVADLNLPRRSLYIQTVRQDRGNFSTLFDAANPEQSVESRSVSTVAAQALFLLNSELVQVSARCLARRLVEHAADDDSARIEQAYRWLYGRPPRPEELEIGRSFLARGVARGRDDALFDYAHVLLCSNEFLYVD
jgi:hypothetical protein